MKNSNLFVIAILFFTLFFSGQSQAGDKAEISNGQIIYVPAYSHIYSGDRERPFLLTVTLSIRNIDPKHNINITLVDYYETQGKRLGSYLEKQNLFSL